MEKHCSSGGDGDFGDAGDVVECVWRDGGRIYVVGLVAEGGVKQDLVIGEDAEGATGEGMGSYGFLKHAKC